MPDISPIALVCAPAGQRRSPQRGMQTPARTAPPALSRSSTPRSTRHGGRGPEIPVSREDLQKLLLEAARQGSASEVVWVQGDSELIVSVGKVAVALEPGLIVITIPVRCDQIDRANIVVPFAVGDAERPAGMIVATEDRPRGPALIVDAWGEALLAFAWDLVMTLTTAVADASGADVDGAGLIPAALTASSDGIRVLTMARHAFDRNMR